LNIQKAEDQERRRHGLSNDRPNQIYVKMSVMKLISGLILFFALTLFVAAPLFIGEVLAAGPPGPPGGGGDPPCWPAPCVPIDGGLGILLLAGLAYGGKKAYQTIKDKKS